MEPIDPLLVVTGKELAELAIKGWVGKELIEKLLGPTAAYLGEQVKGLTEKCNININNIFQRAARKAGTKLEQPGAVPPRILRAVLTDGAFTDDEVASEYFGGILASSRTADGQDDRGVAFVALIRDLSTFQIRLHYLFYRAARAFFSGQKLVVGLPRDRDRMRLFIPLSVFATVVEAADDELPSILEHTVHGLGRSGLIDPSYYFGRVEYVRRSWTEAPGAGLLLTPSAYGAELYLWAHGLGHLPVARFLDQALIFERSDESSLPDGILAVPIQEDIAAIKLDCEKAAHHLALHIEIAERRLEEHKHLPAFPNDLREHVRYILERLRDVTNGVAAFFLDRDLETCLTPPEDATSRDILQNLKTLHSRLLGLLREAKAKEDEPETTA